MKRYILTSNKIHLADCIDNIIHIDVIDNIDDAYYINASVDIEQSEDDAFYLTMTDAQLSQIDDARLSQIVNPQLLDRLNVICPDRLSLVQKQILQNEYKKKVIIDKSDVEALLIMFKKCKSISYDFKHKKTNRFLLDTDKDLRKDDCLAIIHQLTVEDYVASSRSFNLAHLGNNIIIFEPEGVWEFSDGSKVEDLKIYVKLDVDETTKDAIALISMHAAEYQSDHPYKDK